MKKSTHYLVQSAVIAALYAVLTIGQNVLLPGTASMAVQFRVAEVMTVLAFFTNAAIPGLTLGCIIANISSVTAGLGFYDMIFGSVASLLAALTMYALRNVRIKNLPRLPVSGRLCRSRRARCAGCPRTSAYRSCRKNRT